MQITHLRTSGFQSFGPTPTTIALRDVTYVLGPNGAGKTAVLEALSRLFSPLPTQRKIRHSDFHIAAGRTAVEVHADGPELWIEVDIEVKETGEDGEHPSVPPNFAHMRIATEDGVPRIRVRLTATIALDNVIEEKLQYILEADADGTPTQRADMSRFDRANIEVHYLPARRDPAEHIAYTTTSLVGRALRAADWTAERTTLDTLSKDLTDSLAGNAAVKSIGVQLAGEWSGLHSGAFFTDPSIGFGSGDLESVLRQLTVSFAPSPAGSSLPFDRLSDGQKSLLYISLVLAWQSLAREVLDGTETAFDQHRLRPPVHTIIALEEPENSLAPQYLGRIIRQLRKAAEHGDSQALIATHSPALLRRVNPEAVCFLRLDGDRQSQVRRIVLPSKNDDTAKYVREAVLAFPELYFSRLVVLGEGDSEQIVLPRVLAAAGIAEDDASVSVVPLGGRHVNHFWRLLNELEIPHITLLDLDSGRYQGGWGRVSNALKQYNNLNPGTFTDAQIDGLAKWDDLVDFPVYNDVRFKEGHGAIYALEQKGVYFSHPVDLDLMMLEAFSDAYGVESIEAPDEKTIAAVLGKSHANEDHLPEDAFELFDDYHRLFDLKSKPASHLKAMAALTNEQLLADLPGVLQRLAADLQAKLEALPE
ncbi:ATP-dependent nuclease [Okibacterium fritillariae]|uniref:Predicted ATP-dependent endonuclease of the OLD family, contains P-loop ATPase and TOPRIM domains n=1 Tax=Okibacterium fritillariae TaxID=123320 RepID=A0A1T5JU99_9MICO|nr:AAA family ATPase [Okibacterium fritillariae]SKC54798.1 Predicted ATP-dependent endonuclease of the OLD family, contains P-loop ATPase and TOPRIM domains [Okibacterium fritillariae]